MLSPVTPRLIHSQFVFLKRKYSRNQLVVIAIVILQSLITVSIISPFCL
jgi:hypothetical protein